MAIYLPDGSPEVALSFIRDLQAQPQRLDLWQGVEVGPWASIRVHIPVPDLRSEITPPYMEAFLELQKQTYQLVAFVLTGVADARLLGEADRRAHQVNVKVTDGSSNYLADYRDSLDRLLKQMIGKMNGKQAVTVILGSAALLSGTYGFSYYLESKKEVAIAELKSKDHIEALRAVTFVNEKQVEQFKGLEKIVQAQGALGEKAVEAVTAVNDALLKAAARTPKSEINGQSLTQDEAQLLRTSPKKKSETSISIQRMRVVDINTDNPSDLQIVIKTPDGGEEYRIKLEDSLFAGPQRDKLFDALKSRNPIWVELALKEIDGEIRSVQLLRPVDPPPEISQSDSD